METQSQISPPGAPGVIRWYVNLIENLALSWHWGQEDRQKELEDILKHAVALLYEGRGDSHGCPWPICPDGVCSPICMIGCTDDSAFLEDALRCPSASRGE